MTLLITTSVSALASPASDYEIELPAGSSFSFAPVSGYVNGWWNRMLADGPTGLMQAAGDRDEFLAWLSTPGPHSIRLTSSYAFIENDGDTTLRVSLQIEGVDERWQVAIGDLVDRFLEDRLSPYIVRLHQRQQVPGEIPAP